MNLTSIFGSHAKQTSMTISTSARSPLHIPEILSIIFFYLDQYTLTRNAQYVCRQWCALSSSHIRKSALLHVAHNSKKRLDKVLSSLPAITNLSITSDRCWDIELAQWISSKVDSYRAHGGLRVNKIDAVNVAGHAALLYPLFPKFNALTEISMSKIMEDVDLSNIIFSCNELLSFRIVNQRWGDYRINASTLPGDDAITLQPKTSKIQRLTINGMCIDLEELSAFLQRCPKLTSMKFIHIRQIESSIHKAGFYASVVDSCPKLQQFHFSALNENPTPDHASIFMKAFFPSSISSDFMLSEQKEENQRDQNQHQLVHQTKIDLKTISILDRDVKQETAGILFLPLMSPISSQFVTTLEIMPSIEHVQNDCLTIALHDVLCSSPHLLHLIAPFVPYYAEYFDIASPGNSNKVWACRGLRTLKLRIVSRKESEEANITSSRIMFGYISKVCPNLHDLSLYREELYLKLEGGMCFLSRLKQLRRLAIVTRTKTKLRRKDLAWISGSSSSAGRSWFSGLFNMWKKNEDKKSLTITRTNSSDITCVNSIMRESFQEIGTEKDYKACLNEISKDKDSGMGCWPVMSYLGIRHTDNNRNDPDDYLPSLISKIRPGVEFSCNYNELLEIE